MSKKAQQQADDVALTERTSHGLRTVLFDELDGLRRGTSNATRANAVAKLASTIVETVRMEIDVARFAETNKKLPDSKKSLGAPINFAE